MALRVGLTAFGSIAVWLCSAHAKNVSSHNFTPVQHDVRHDVDHAGASLNSAFSMLPCFGLDVEEASITELQALLTGAKLTSRKLLQCYRHRIAQVDPYVEAIMELNPDVEHIADVLDAERARGHVRGPLHGLPFLVKDNIATKDRMQTTAGSWALLGSVVPRDAHVVHLLREAGALLLGHATLSEWADMRSTNYSEGYSPRGGQARSPYNATLMPGGSSSGSGGAVAANECVFALGTETDGSVINPAERASLVGLKPTVGLTSRAGVVPESEHQDTVGVLARSVADAAVVLGAIAGIDPRDNYTLAQAEKPGRTFRNYTQFLAGPEALKGAVFGLPWKSFWVHAREDNLPGLLRAVKLIEEAGGRVINNTEIRNYETTVAQNGWDWDWGSTRGRPNESEFTVVKIDFYNNIKSYLAELNHSNVHSLEDIVAYNNANDGTEGGTPGVLPAFASGQDSFLASLASKGIRDETYWQALGYVQRATREDGIDAALHYTGADGKALVLDGLLVPSDAGQTYQIAAQAGYPMITIPAGINSWGMPYGLGIMHTAWSESILVKWGSAIEALVQGRQRPTWYMAGAKNIPVILED